MSKEIQTNYTFDASNKKVALTDKNSVEIAKLYAIINVTRGVTYYTLGSSDKIVTISGNEITLNAGVSTSGHANTDTLFILYEDTEILEVLQAIRRGINALCNTIGVATPDTAGRLRVNVETGSTIAAISNVNGYGGYSTAPHVQATLNLNAGYFRNNIVVTE
jgi:hypothetical protein